MSDTMDHDQVQDLLEDYVDERLDRAARRAVDEHLDGCERCAALLDEVPAVDLSGLGETVWDERAMRNAVRRSMLRTAANSAVLLVAGALVVLLASSLVLQPLLVGRDGRAVAATRLTAGLAIMFNPGAAVEDWSYDSGVLSRTSRVRLVSSIGSRVSELGVVESRLTPTGFGDAGGGPFHPMVVRETGGTFDLASRLARLGDGTVATIELVWSDPISLEAAGALARSPHDVRVVWLGFAVDDSSGYSGPGFDPGGVLGGPACADSQLPNEISSRGGGAGGGNAFVSEPSAERAWGHVEDVLDELLEHPEFIESLGRDWSREDVEQAARSLDEQRVRSMVVTGPTTELRAFVESAGSDFGGVRDVDFYNWFTPICGR